MIPGDGVVPGLHTTAPALFTQIDTLEAEGYAFIPLAEMLARLGARRPVARCIAVTFDDAYRGLELVLPELQRRGIPSTIFVPTASVGAGKGYWWDRLERIRDTMPAEALAAFAREICGAPVPSGSEFENVRASIMARDGGRLTAHSERLFAAALMGAATADTMLCAEWDTLVRWLQWDGVTFAPHTVTHPVLPLLSLDEQRSEIVESHAALREAVGSVLPVIAYPYGLYDGTTLRAAREAGMTGGVTMDRVGCAPRECTPFSVPRLPFGGATPAARMGIYLSTPWRWYRRRDQPGGFPRIPRVTDAVVAPEPVRAVPVSQSLD